MGQSAGAMALDLLQVSPLAHGLYAKMVALSGGYHGVAAPHLETLAETEAKGVKLQQAMKARDVAQMRTIPADQITVTAASNKIVFSAAPPLTAMSFPARRQQVYAAGQQQDVPLLLASVGNDIFSKNAVTDARTLADYRRAAQDLYGADAPAFLKLFPAKNDAEAATQAQAIARISGFGIMGRDWAKDASRACQVADLAGAVQPSPSLSAGRGDHRHGCEDGRRLSQFRSAVLVRHPGFAEPVPPHPRLDAL